MFTGYWVTKLVYVNGDPYTTRLGVSHTYLKVLVKDLPTTVRWSRFYSDLDLGQLSTIYIRTVTFM